MVVRAVVFGMMLVSQLAHAEQPLSSDDFLYALSAGIAYNEVDTLLDGGDSPAAVTSDKQQEAMLAFSAHVPFSENHEIGAQVQYGNIDGEGLGVIRFLDYRYRLFGDVRLKAFFGVARYDLATPAHGYYLGAGAEMRFFDDGIGFSIEGAYGDKIARDRVLASDPPATKTPEIFYDITAVNAYLSWYF